MIALHALQSSPFRALEAFEAQKSSVSSILDIDISTLDQLRNKYLEG